jgi:DNA-binding transcriptional ArsR family regulator
MPSYADHAPGASPLSAGDVTVLCRSMRAFSTASRVRLLYALLERERTVAELARAAAITESSASHQLRMLRRAHLVAAEPAGRHVRYRLYDHHVAELLVAIRHHAEHVPAGLHTSAEVPA